MKDFRQLKVWQKAHQLTLAIYQITASFPREEIYGLTSQMRRAATSISANLAEGCGRNSDAELDECSLNNYTMMTSSILYFQRNTTGAALISSKY